MPHTSLQILAIIPARGGSRGIPHKNIRNFAGKPLIAHSIEVAIAAPSVHRTVVSTDDVAIAESAKKYGAEVPFLRPAELAGDSSQVVDAVIHLLESLKRTEKYEPTHVMLLQPTSPLRTSDDIEKAVALLRERNADSLVSVCRSENLLFTKGEDDVLHALTGQQSANRQEVPTCYRLDGSMIYLTQTEMLLAARSFLSGKLVGYEIERWRAVDLDEPQDFVLGERIFGMRDEIEKDIRNFS